MSIETRLYTLFAALLVQHIVPWRYRLEKSLSWFGAPMLELSETFGELEIDWEAGTLTTRALRATDGSVSFERDWRFDELGMHASPSTKLDVEGAPCEPYRGQAHQLHVFAAYATCVLLLVPVLLAKPFIAILVLRWAWRRLRHAERTTERVKHA
eukprot:scaffold201600_cov30-Tisochrysis_lutea.AAC.3